MKTWNCDWRKNIPLTFSHIFTCRALVVIYLDSSFWSIMTLLSLDQLIIMLLVSFVNYFHKTFAWIICSIMTISETSTWQLFSPWVVVVKCILILYGTSFKSPVVLDSARKIPSLFSHVNCMISQFINTN